MVQITIQNQTFNFKDVYKAFDFLQKKVEIKKQDDGTCFEDLDFRKLEPSEITSEIQQMAKELDSANSEEFIDIR